MTFLSSKASSFFMATTLLALAACTGMSPGGGAPGEGSGPVALAPGGNSLDGGDGSGGGGLPIGGPLGDAGSDGQAVPGSQQSTDSIGGGCARSYHVRLKVLHNGAEEGCIAATHRFHSGEVTIDNSGGVLDPGIEVDGPPQVTVDPAGAQPATRSLVCVAGHWETAEPVFFRAVCSAGFEVTASATWRYEGRTYLSNVFTGAPTYAEGDYSPLPLDLTINLGYDSPAYQYDADNAVNVAY